MLSLSARSCGFRVAFLALTLCLLPPAAAWSQQIGSSRQKVAALLLQLKTGDRRQKMEAMKAVPSLAPSEALQVLSEAVKVNDRNVQLEAAKLALKQPPGVSQKVLPEAMKNGQRAAKEYIVKNLRGLSKEVIAPIMRAVKEERNPQFRAQAYKEATKADPQDARYWLQYAETDPSYVARLSLFELLPMLDKEYARNIVFKFLQDSNTLVRKRAETLKSQYNLDRAILPEKKK